MAGYSFELSAPAEIIFGSGKAAGVGASAARWGKKVLLFTGSHPERAGQISASLEGAGLKVEIQSVSGEPDIDGVEEAARTARAMGAEVIVACGGGSVIDAAKATAALVANNCSLMDCLEIVGAGRPLTKPSLPWIAMPTTAGTGADVTRNAVISVPKKKLKVSLRSPLMPARVAIVDPELCVGMPRFVAGASALDALTQLIEAYVSCRANVLSDALCRGAIPRAARAIEGLASGTGDAAMLEELSWAATASGIALSCAGLGAVHGLAAPLGGAFGVPHGAVCAALLAPIIEANLHALERNLRGGDAISRYVEIACWLSGKADTEQEDSVSWVNRTVGLLGLPGLKALGANPARYGEIAEAGLRASSMKGNPVELQASALVGAMQAAG
jgi:alcohol dehydrogenase class IV